MRVFEDRAEAGRELAAVLADRLPLEAKGRTVVLAIPRGGLAVGAEVAAALGAEFEVAVVRKLRSPHNPELGFGAIGADDHVDIDEGIAARIGLSREQVEAEIEDRRQAVRRRLETYRRLVPETPLEGKVVVVVDDGVATGGTARQACALARRAGAKRVILAVPVGPDGTVEEFADVADDVVVLTTPAEFIAVGQAYRDFHQVDEREAEETITRALSRPPD